MEILKKLENQVSNLVNIISSFINDKNYNSSISIKIGNDVDNFINYLWHCDDKSQKVYSIQERGVACIAKRKTGKPLKFRSKCSIMVTKDSGVITGVKNFQGNTHDSNTLNDTLSVQKKTVG